MQETTLVGIDFSDFSSFIFAVNHFLTEEEDNPLEEKVVLDQEELDGVDIDGIRNLEDLRRIVFIEPTKSIDKKKKPDVLRAFRCPLCDILCVSSVSMRNILNKLGKHYFSCR